MRIALALRAWRCGCRRSRRPAGPGARAAPAHRSRVGGSGNLSSASGYRRLPGQEDGVRAHPARRGRTRGAFGRAGCQRIGRRGPDDGGDRRPRGSHDGGGGAEGRQQGALHAFRKFRGRGRGEANGRRPGARLSVVWGWGGRSYNGSRGRAALTRPKTNVGAEAPTRQDDELPVRASGRRRRRRSAARPSGSCRTRVFSNVRNTNTRPLRSSGSL